MADSTLKDRQSLTLGLIAAVEDLFPAELLHINYSILDGIYAELESSLVSPREVKLIESHLHEWAEADTPIFCQAGEDGFFHCINNGKTIRTLYPTGERSGVIRKFDLIPYAPGFILHFPSPDHPEEITPFIPPAKLSATFAESHRWVKNLGLAQVRDINRVIREDPNRLIYLAEALHEKMISAIADKILDRGQRTRVVLIAGPSSSGKTAFAQRLAIQLRVNGLSPVHLSLDNYFLSREQTPRDAQGQYNFEILEALDLPLLNEQILKLIKGEEVETPLYRFASGTREKSGKKMRLSPQNILIIEGIHGLNPRLFPSLERDQLFRIYVSALFQPNIDPYNRIPTTQVRLIRRLIRDDLFRAIPPAHTLKRWASVRNGEDTNIFPYQEEADVMFNSSLLYELNVLRPYTESLLVTIPPDSPDYPTAQNGLRLLSFFTPLEDTKVPFNSILREFLGNSIFNF